MHVSTFATTLTSTEKIKNKKDFTADMDVLYLDQWKLHLRITIVEKRIFMFKGNEDLLVIRRIWRDFINNCRNNIPLQLFIANTMSIIASLT